MIEVARMWTEEELGRVFDYLLVNHAHSVPGDKQRRPVPPSVLPFKIEDVVSVVRDQFEAALVSRNGKVVEVALFLVIAFKVPSASFFDLACQLVTEDWHISHEDLVRHFQDAEDPQAIPYIKQVTELKPRLEYLAYDDYGAFYKKCLWALAAIGTAEAIAIIRECSNSNIDALRGEARYRLTRIYA